MKSKNDESKELTPKSTSKKNQSKEPTPIKEKEKELSKQNSIKSNDVSALNKTPENANLNEISENLENKEIKDNQEMRQSNDKDKNNLLLNLNNSGIVLQGDDSKLSMNARKLVELEKRITDIDNRYTQINDKLIFNQEIKKSVKKDFDLIYDETKKIETNFKKVLGERVRTAIINELDQAAAIAQRNKFEMRELVRKVEEYTFLINELESQNYLLNIDKRRLVEENKDIKNELDYLKINYNNQNKELDNLKKEIINKNEKINSLLNEIDDMKGVYSKLTEVRQVLNKNFNQNDFKDRKLLLESGKHLDHHPPTLYGIGIGGESIHSNNNNSVIRNNESKVPETEVNRILYNNESTKNGKYLSELPLPKPQLNMYNYKSLDFSGQNSKINQDDEYWYQGNNEFFPPSLNINNNLRSQPINQVKGSHVNLNKYSQPYPNNYNQNRGIQLSESKPSYMNNSPQNNQPQNLSSKPKNNKKY